MLMNTCPGAGALVGQVGVLDARLRAAVLALAPALEQAAREAVGDESTADPADAVALRLLASQVGRFSPSGSAAVPRQGPGSSSAPLHCVAGPLLQLHAPWYLLHEAAPT